VVRALGLRLGRLARIDRAHRVRNALVFAELGELSDFIRARLESVSLLDLGT
jgi:hypothetical protein